MPSILVVEDEELGRTVLSKMLRAGGHGVTEMVDGQQALSHKPAKRWTHKSGFCVNAVDY